MKKTDSVRKKIKSIEQKMMKEKAKLAKLRSRAKPVQVQNYELTTSDGKSVKLFNLFGKKNELILIHNMGTSCPYCTMWADGFNGFLPHLENRAAFVVETPDRPQTIKKFKKSRKWNFNMVSSRGTTFRNDMGYEFNGDPGPGVSVFVKKNGKIFRVSDSLFGPGDNFCPVWDLMDLLPSGPGNWQAKFKY